MELRGGMFGSVLAPEDGDARGVWLKRADEDAGFARGGRGMRAENGKRLRMLAAKDQVDFGGGDAGIGERRFGDSRMVQSSQCVSPKLRIILTECERGGEYSILRYSTLRREECGIGNFPVPVLDRNGAHR